MIFHEFKAFGWSVAILIQDKTHTKASIKDRLKKLFPVKHTPLSIEGQGARGRFIYDPHRKKVVPINDYQSVNQFQSMAKHRDSLGAIHRDGVKVWENGKCKVLDTKRAVADHAARNGLVMGGDDLEQEAQHNKARLEQADAQKSSDAIDDAIGRVIAKTNKR